METAKKLNDKQKRFVDEYLIDLNATQAAARAGYSQKTAGQIGERLLRKVEIQQAIAERKQARQERTEITQDRVLQELARIAFFDVRKLYREDGSLKGPHELDDDAAAVLAGVDVVEIAGGMQVDGKGRAKHVPMFTKKAKIPDKVAALALTMRHLGMLQDKVDHTSKGDKLPAPAEPAIINVTVGGK